MKQQLQSSPFILPKDPFDHNYISQNSPFYYKSLLLASLWSKLRGICREDMEGELMGTAHKSSTFRNAILLYIDQPTLGVLNFGFIKYVCISEPELYLKNPLYIFLASGHKNISKKPKSFVSLIYVPSSPNYLPSWLLFISWERAFLRNLVKENFKNTTKITNITKAIQFLSCFYARIGPVSFHLYLHATCYTVGVC